MKTERKDSTEKERKEKEWILFCEKMLEIILSKNTEVLKRLKE